MDAKANLLTVTEAAARLGVHPSRVRALIAAGRLAAMKHGARVWLIEEAALTAVAERKPGRPADSFEVIEARIERLSQIARRLNTERRCYGVEYSEREGDDWLSRYPGYYLCWNWRGGFIDRFDLNDPEDQYTLEIPKHEKRGEYLGRYFKYAKEEIEKIVSERKEKRG